MKDSSPSGESDEELARRAVAGEHAAFEALVGRHQDKVYRLARRLTRSPADAEEVLQETFVRAYRRLGTFRGEARFSTWLYRVATNAALMLRRRQARHPTESLEQFLPRFDRAGRHARDADHARAARADEILDRARLARRAAEALERLPDRYRAPFVLRDLEEMPTAEVAMVLGVSNDVVRQRVHRARLMLRGWLSHLVGAEP
ncbi:MAG TPA: sigma-70 family RNA polymerase sigma factor [Vicinamibacteria bacterium]|nr:sigma-70 family RNA polymerase sigma factor [Vicinamibacteria bacterium]